MTSYHNGFLYLSDGFGNPVELINHARTAHNLTAAAHASFGHVLDSGGCEALEFHPCDMFPDGSVVEWSAVDMLVNPWGNAGAAAEGLGFYIQEWTGIDGAHHARSSSPVGGGHGGARFGPMSHRQRVMALNVVLVGTTERGLNHLFRWLESALLTTGASGCLGSMWLRDVCPDGLSDAELEVGLLRADEVTLVDGPAWISPPVEDAGCFLRAVSFTLVAGSPCLFAVPASSSTTTVTAPALSASAVPAYFAACNEWSGSVTQVSAAVVAPDFGLTSPLVKFSSPLEVDGSTMDRKVVPAYRIFASVDDENLGEVLLEEGGGELLAETGWSLLTETEVPGVLNPCTQRRLGLVIVQNLPSGYELVVDCSDGTAQARDLHGDRQWYDGAQFIANNFDISTGYGGRRSVSLPAQCADGWFVVEPAFGGSFYLGLDVASVSTWTITLQAVTRVGCL